MREIIFQPENIMITASENLGRYSRYWEFMTKNVTTNPITRIENLVMAPASLLVVLFARPSRLVIPPKKLEPILAIQMASKLLLVLHLRPRGSIFSMAALLMTCSMTFTAASMAAKPSADIQVKALLK